MHVPHPEICCLQKPKYFFECKGKMLKMLFTTVRFTKKHAKLEDYSGAGHDLDLSHDLDL